MLFGHSLGANPFSSIARGVTHVATDSRVQNVASVAAQQYAPQQYAQAQQIARQVSSTLNPRRPAPQAQMMPMAPMQITDDVGPGNIQNTHFLTYAAIGGGLLVILLLMRK